MSKPLTRNDEYTLIPSAGSRNVEALGSSLVAAPFFNYNLLQNGILFKSKVEKI